MMSRKHFIQFAEFSVTAELTEPQQYLLRYILSTDNRNFNEQTFNFYCDDLRNKKKPFKHLNGMGYGVAS